MRQLWRFSDTMHCCSHNSIEEQFGRRVAERDLERYARKGPDSTTQRLLRGVETVGVRPASVMDIGGGVGVIPLELLEDGVETALLVEASPSYAATARAEAERRGYGSRLECREGDFVELADQLPSADLVTLHRVVCCYPDVERLVRLSASKAATWIGLTYPRNRWYVKAVIALENLVRRLRGRSFRAYVHDTRRIQALLREAGFARGFSHLGLVWAVVLYRRSELP